MLVLGISGSPRPGATTDQLVKAVLDGVECKTEFISLHGKNLTPCGACLGCVETNECIIQDDMTALRERILQADAYVIGAPNYFGMLNAQTHTLLERWYQFRHQDARMLGGRFGVAVGVGAGAPQAPIENIKTFFQYNDIECVDEVAAEGAASCFICGHGLTCRDGAVYSKHHGADQITPAMIPNLASHPEIIERAHLAGRTLSARLSRH
jgi:multimeric flavodoxin WrbA